MDHLVIDGMYLIFSSYYAHRNMRDLKGNATGAVFGFVNRLESLIKELQPVRVTVAMDSGGKTFRHKMYGEYKAGRQAPPEDLPAQIEQIKKYMKLRHLPWFECPGFEADDIIATTAGKSASDFDRVIIFTADKDLFQLVKDNIYIYHPKKKIIMDSDETGNTFGVKPEQIVDYLALTGDASDNIPGVPGIGDKSAKKLLEKWGNIDAILENLADVEDKFRKKIEKGMDELKMSRELVDLKKAPELILEDKGNFEEKIEKPLLEFYKDFGFATLLKRFSGDVVVTEEKLDAEYNFVKTITELQELPEILRAAGKFSFDVETTGFRVDSSDLMGISFACGNKGYYLSFTEHKDFEYTVEDFVKVINPVFKDSSIGKSGHNVKFDMQHLKKAGIDVKGISDDSMVMAYLIYPNRRTHKLKELAMEFFNYSQKSFDELTNGGKIPYSEVDPLLAGRYCIDDSIVSLKLVDMFTEELSRRGLTDLYKSIEIPLIPVLADMEYRGIKVDMNYLVSSSEEMEKHIKQLEEDIYEIADGKFNINSSQQLGELLFEKMGLPVKKRTKKTGSYSTDSEVLNELKAYPVVEKVIDYRSSKKLQSTYLKGLIGDADTNDVIHTSFNQTIAATGRLSSSDPNLQNIPTGAMGGVVMRSAFVPREGMKLMAADYSQVELRVMAHFSKDVNLIKAFRDKLDIHQMTADKVLGGGLFDDPVEQRKKAKVINFSVLYGSGAYSLAKELGVTYGVAADFINTYFEKYSGVKDFVERVVEECAKDPVVSTISGRKRDVPEILSKNKTVMENGRRMAINTIIQGSAADIIKLAMIKVAERIKGMESEMLLQVHDELVFEYPLHEEEDLKKIVEEEMAGAVDLLVPLEVKVVTGNNWGELK